MIDGYYALLLLSRLCLVNHVIVIVSLHTILHMLSFICFADDGDYNNANPLLLLLMKTVLNMAHGIYFVIRLTRVYV